MHLPTSTQYFIIGANDHQMIDFYEAVDAIYTNFSIKINLQQISLEPFLELLKVEIDRDFIIFLRSESNIFRSKVLNTFNEVFSKSPRCHKVTIIREEQEGYEEVGRQIYFNLLGSLNLVYIFSRDGYIKTHGIRITENSKIKSTLISLEIDPLPVEIVNLQPIILDTKKCGVLGPVLYFVSKDFGTCIGQILLPGSSYWSLAYFIQCDDSGRNDQDMVKVCLVNEEEHHHLHLLQHLHQHNLEYESHIALAIEKKEMSVLKNPEYPFCDELNSLLKDLNHFPKDIKIVELVNKKIDILMKLCHNDDGSIFPDARNSFEIKKKYAKLYKELNSMLENVRDKRANSLKNSLKSIRKMINVLCVYVKHHNPENQTNNIINPKVTTKDSSSNPKWLVDARRLASHNSRISTETNLIRKGRLESEKTDGIISMPFLEPYLDLKWPPPLNKQVEKLHPVIERYSEFLKANEEQELLNKRFGL